MKVSVIVVSYNTVEHLNKCLAAIEPHHEIIVVDNGSKDGSPDLVRTHFPHVTLIESGSNLGFGRANNLGIERATGDLVLLLNSDAEPLPGAIDLLAANFEDRRVVAAGGQLLDEDGNEQNSACSPLTLWVVLCEQLYLEKLFPRSALVNPYWQNSRLVGDGPFDVAQCMGACLMMRKMETFDPRYFLYCEDTELCHRLKRHGRIIFDRRAKFRHALGASSTGNRWRSVALYNYGKELYFSIHTGPLQRVTCLILNRLGAALRLAFYGPAAIVSASKRSQAKMWWQVLTAKLWEPMLPPDTAR